MQDSQVSGDGLAVDGGGQPTAQRRFASLEAWLAESMVHGAATPEVEVDEAEGDVDDEAAVIAAEAEADADEAAMPSDACPFSPRAPHPVLLAPTRTTGYKSFASPKVAAAVVSAKPAAAIAAKQIVARRTPLGDIGNLQRTKFNPLQGHPWSLAPDRL